MQTVHFQCGHCGNLMAVSEEFLGQQVCCPHCEQVVSTSAPTAPEPGSTPVPEPQPTPPLSPLDAVTSDSPPLPFSNLSLDAAVAVSEPQPEVGVLSPAANWSTTAQPESAPPEPVPSPNLSGENPFGLAPAASVSSPEPSPDPSAPVEDIQATPDTSWLSPAATGAAAPAPEGLTEAIPQPVIRPPRSRAWLVPLTFTLFTYSVLSTILVVYLYFRTPPSFRSPLEELPDVDTPYKGATKRKQESRRIKHDLDLPPHLRVQLGKSITIGDLTVTPLKLELRKLTYLGNDGPYQSPRESLVLTLQLENSSRDVVFHPTDPYFDRRVKDTGDRPYTFLEVEQAPLLRFYGGAIDAAGDPVEGMTYAKALEPGEKMTTLVCTDPDADVKKALRDYHGPWLWRVQVRRGLVQVRDREVSATAVVGIEFTGKDVVKPGSPG